MQEQDPFYISKRNRRGVLALFIFSLVIVFTPRVLMSFVKEDEIIISSEAIKSLDKKRSYFQRDNYFKKKYSREQKYKTPTSKFNPNEYSKEQWEKLGLSEKQAVVVLKFTSRGIYSNDDLKKIFVIPAVLFNKIKDSTFYPQKQTLSIIERELNQDRSTTSLLDLNNATEDEFTKINGIGGFYAKQIGPLLKPDVNWTAAIIFYLLFVVGLVVFVIMPAIEKNSWTHALLFGALFGLVCYATYDLTNLAVTKDWPLLVTIVDLVWGAVLAASVSAVTYFIATKIGL